jgi:glycine oxidase
MPTSAVAAKAKMQEDYSVPAADVIIVGGGVIGCSIAYYLAQAGARVTIFERGEIGGEASGAAAGMLAPLDDSLQQGPLDNLCLASLQLFRSLADSLRDETGIDVEYVRSGVLRITFTEEDATLLRQQVERMQGLLQWVDSETMHALEPRLAPTRGGFYFPHLYHVNAGRLTQALAQAAAARGAVLRRGIAVTGLLTDRSRVTGVRSREGRAAARHVVLAAGPWTAAFGRQLRVPLPVSPVRGQMLAFASSPVRHMVAWEEERALLPKPNGFLFVGSTAESVGFRKNTTAKALALLRRIATTSVPSLAYAEVASTWAGLRPASPDGLPILGPVPGWEGVSVASGHFRKGVLLAPITGQFVAQRLTQGEPDKPLDAAFAPTRFASSRP